tara:strand:+ start:656 stop:1324 length:669 start_codon:yes stop_codon:yes gene_type:complete
MTSTNIIKQQYGGEMDDEELQHGGSYEKTSFVNYMTSFSSKEQSQVLNLLQYGGLSILPILSVLKLMKAYLPNEPSQLKPTSELIIEVVLQLTIIVVAFFFIHKMIVYLPTYSQQEYDSYSLMSGILPLFFLMFTLDTKISEKLNTLFDRLLLSIGIMKEPMVEGNDDSEETDGSLTQPGTSVNSSVNSPVNTIRGDSMPSPPQQEPFIETMSGCGGGFAPF